MRLVLRINCHLLSDNMARAAGPHKPGVGRAGPAWRATWFGGNRDWRRIDKAPASPLIPRVTVVRRVAALALAVLWLTGVLHCRLEAAGIFFGADCCDAAPGAALPAADHADHGCENDSCETAEGAFTPAAPEVLKVPSPESPSFLLPGLAVPPPAELSPPPVTGVIAATTAPPDLARPWILFAPAPLSPQAP